ncbi:ubiquitin carboxyl-terminal hydrolase [Mycolicibacterium canariasense]|uniref:Ubiquitin carboxyl-terminal hydrolase n=1 Tax=Mycolicibacterium canariasense TaxID=228230 RepID=A0A100WBX6_MYCCR|nr:ubiquitin carboxyl-terminal hydrolase [Mycolicibacterium canariasense]
MVARPLAEHGSAAAAVGAETVAKTADALNRRMAIGFIARSYGFAARIRILCAQWPARVADLSDRSATFAP